MDQENDMGRYGTPRSSEYIKSPDSNPNPIEPGQHGWILSV